MTYDTYKYIPIDILFMRKDKDFRIETIRLNRHNVKVRVPKRSITLEEASRIQKKILSKYAKKSF